VALYPALLGPAWASLAPEVQRLHAGGAVARGRVRVVRGAGRLARALAALLGMPTAGDGVPVTLSVELLRDGERWTRLFGDRRVSTVQWRRGALLVEAVGIVACLFRLEVERAALVFHQVGARVGVRGFTLPLPRWLAPRVEGRAAPGDGGVHVDVRIHAPLAGLIVSYEGWARAQGAERPS
jgi:hypothetical protein